MTNCRLLLGTESTDKNLVNPKPHGLTPFLALALFIEPNVPGSLAHVAIAATVRAGVLTELNDWEYGTGVFSGQNGFYYIPPRAATTRVGGSFKLPYGAVVVSHSHAVDFAGNPVPDSNAILAEGFSEGDQQGAETLQKMYTLHTPSNRLSIYRPSADTPSPEGTINLGAKLPGSPPPDVVDKAIACIKAKL